MFSFSKNKKAENKPSIVAQIQSFAPMIKSMLGFDIESVVPMFLQGIAEAEKRIGDPLNFMITSDENNGMLISVYRMSLAKKEMNLIHSVRFASTFGAVDEFSKLTDFLKTFNPSESNDNTPENNGHTAAIAESAEPITEPGADTGNDTASDEPGTDTTEQPPVTE